MFAGLSVDSTSILIRYTFLGDANLDGTVNALDFNALATNCSADIPEASLPFASALVPEPAMVMIPVLLALNIRRRRCGHDRK